MRERASCGWLDLFVSLYACMCACVAACVCVCKSRGCQAKTTWQCRALTQLGWAGMSSHVPSWCVCAQCAHTAARPNLWSSFLLTLTHSFPLSHLSVFHLSTSLLSALSPSLPYLSLALVVSSLLVWKVLSHPESILKFCLWTLLIFYAPHPKKKTKNRWHFFPVFLVSSSSLSSPPPSLFSPCFFPSSRCSTDPNWQSTCLFSLFTHSLI